MATELEELIDFLSSPSPPVKRAAVDIVRGLTGSDDGLQSLAKYSNIVLQKLVRLLGEAKEVAEPAAESLINLSQNTDLAGKMITMGMINTLMEILYKQELVVARLLVMLLVNLTQLDAGVASLLQTEEEKMHGLYVMKLVRSFCTSPREDKGDPFEHVGSILVNISKAEQGRKLLLDPKRGLLKQIIRQFDSISLIRKKGGFEHEFPWRHVETLRIGRVTQNLVVYSRSNRGVKMKKEVNHINLIDLVPDLVRDITFDALYLTFEVAGTIRNCCFDAESQLPNLLLASEFLWPALLLPIAGNKVYSDQDTSKMPSELGIALSIEREQVVDPEIRIQALEAIYLITVQEAGRRALWSVNGPRILQLGYEEEEDPKVMEAYERVGSLLVESGGIEEEQSAASEKPT